MTLMNRMSRLFRADMNAVLDRMEEPDIVLKQAIRDMQTAVAESERQLKALELRRGQTAERLAGLRARCERAGAELDVCLDAGNDDLARSVIQRKLALERSLGETGEQSARLDRAIEEMRHAAERQRRDLDDVRSQAEVFDVTDADCNESPTIASVTADEIEVALLEEKQRRRQS